jgi:hypothetical protein
MSGAAGRPDPNNGGIPGIRDPGARIGILDPACANEEEGEKKKNTKILEIQEIWTKS